MNIQNFQKELRLALRKELPGENAQKKMSVQPFRVFPDQQVQPERNAGVLLLLFPENGDQHIVLTERSQDLENHRGQISFPGGALNLNESNETAALRETEEEINVKRSDVKIIGKLTPLFVPVSGFMIFPIVGISNTKPKFSPNLTEVRRVIFAPILELLEENNIRTEIQKKRDIEFTIPYFYINGHKIWGATAMILAEFLEVICKIKSSLR